jgi:hypothetical protein
MQVVPLSPSPGAPTLRDAAERIVARMKKMYGAPPTYMTTTESEFAHLDLDAYHSFRETLEGHGYKFLADFTILGLTDSPNSPMVPTFIRSMVSADGAILASHYQATPRMGWLVTTVLAGLFGLRFITEPRVFFQSLMTKQCDDFESELDGTYVATSNAEGAQAITLPKSIDGKFFPFGTPLDEVRAAHEARLGAAIRRSGATPTKMTTSADAFAMETRLKECKNAHRAASNWVTQNELRAVSHGNTAIADAIFKEVQSVLAESKKA